MQILGHLCFIFWSFLEFHKRVLQYFLGFVWMDCFTYFYSYLKHLSSNYDFGCGFLMFWSFKQFFEVLGLFMLLGFGLKVLKFRFLPYSGGKSGLFRNGICAENGFDGKFSPEISSCKGRLLKYVCNSTPSVIDKLEKSDTNVYSEECNNDDEENEKQHYYDEDKVFDVLELRKLIKIERGRANSALLELEKERMSAATAVEESMAMILRLQNEKSLIEMESNQYRRLAEEKLLYDQEVIQSLQWLAMRDESDRTLLEDQLRLCHQKLRLFMKGDEMDHFQEVEESFSSSSEDNFEDALDLSLFSSHDLDFQIVVVAVAVASRLRCRRR
ncbi:hypothetical protein ACH5RR_002091 [Cinchona calisaya]|uniref:GTD-binding domain-containing protein n=1 Tax=Cinchona calisaya TaxID=153742 RepID=A0ABD3B595_9GENT